jgi:hypothetical protein
VLAGAFALAAALPLPAHAQRFDLSDQPGSIQAFPNSGEVLVTYGAVPNAVGYNIYRRGLSQSYDQRIRVNPQPIPQTFFLDTGLTNDTPLLYSAKAVFQDGKEGFSPTPEVVVTPHAPILGALFAYDIGTVNPSSWTVGRPGTADAGVLTVRASGGELWDNYDSGTFIGAPVSGDFTLGAQVLARPEGSPNNGAKAGIMVRESLSSGGRYAFLFVSQSREPEVLFEGRKGILGGAPGNFAQAGTSLADTKFPIWLQLRLRGSTISAWQSYDNQNWTPVGTPQDYGRLQHDTYGGLGVTALSDGGYTTARFGTNMYLVLCCPA